MWPITGVKHTSIRNAILRTQNRNTRHSQKITRKVGAIDYETTGIIYPRVKLWTAEATVTYCKTIWGQLSAASVGVSCPKASVSSKTMPGLTQQMPPWWRCDIWSLRSYHTLVIPQTWHHLIFTCLGHWKSPCRDTNSTWMTMCSRRCMSGSGSNHNWHPSSSFPLGQVHWTARGLCWIVSRYFLHCLNKPPCSTTFLVILWLYLV
jgi:hypothetical protein